MAAPRLVAKLPRHCTTVLCSWMHMSGRGGVAATRRRALSHTCVCMVGGGSIGSALAAVHAGLCVAQLKTIIHLFEQQNRTVCGCSYWWRKVQTVVDFLSAIYRCRYNNALACLPCRITTRSHGCMCNCVEAYSAMPTAPAVPAGIWKNQVKTH
jgi:hypothetical protein